MKKSSTTSKTLIFDGQVFQSDAWHRGMGKYSLNLIESILKESHDYQKVYIILSKHAKIETEALDTIKLIAPSAEIVHLNLRVPRSIFGQEITQLQAHNKEELEGFVERQSGSETDFFILSLFIDNVCSVFPDNARKILLFYDLIPLQYAERYGQLRTFTDYLSRYSVIFSADLILTISQTVADDLVVYTGIDAAKIQNIDGAPIARTTQKSKKPVGFKPKQFFIMPSGNDLRKNNARAIQGFEEFRSKYKDQNFWLVITSYFDDHTKRILKQLSDHVIFTGNVSEAELKWLYENAEALLFATEYEGLGLPVLEAVEVNLPVVCSSLSVFDEISPSAFYYFDERNPSSIADALYQCSKKQELVSKLADYPVILKKYSWQRTAETTMHAVRSIKRPNTTEKPRLAVFAPNPMGYSAIGKVVMLTHDALNSKFDVDYYLEDGRTHKDFSRPSFLPALANCYPATDFTARTYARYDSVLYHVGNSEYHVETIKRALYMPGHMIIHDTKLQGVYEGELLRFGHMEESRVAAERQLNDQSKTTKTAYLTSLINSQLSIITHSNYAREVLGALNLNSVPVVTTNLPIGTPVMKKRKRSEVFKIGFGGIIHQSKGLSLVDAIIDAKELNDVEIHIFGVPIVDQAVLDRLTSHKNVVIEQNLSDFEFENKLADMDAVISYRPNYNGETSLTVIEAMRYGVVPIVRNIGWFGELPDEAVQKVKDESQVVEAIKQLKHNPELLKQKSMAAKELMASQFSYTQYAHEIARVINASKNSSSINSKIAYALKNGDSKSKISEILSSS